jgi:hypothetical protein
MLPSFEKSDPKGNRDVPSAGVAPVKVDVAGSGDLREGNLLVVSDPTVRTLDEIADADMKLDRALYRAARRIKFHLYLTLLGLYVLKFRLEVVSLILKFQRNILRSGR